MKLYCYIENVNSEDGTNKWTIIQGPQELPECANNVSNLNALDDNTLKILGWVPFETQSENKAVVVSTEYVITEDCVIERIHTRDKTQEELHNEAERELSDKWERFRISRNNLLLESDKLVLSDRWEKLTEPEKLKISNYRQALRDLSQQNLDPELIIFPKL